MLHMPSLQATADAFLGRYERTIAKKSNGRGNFQFNKRGDLVSIHQLTNHAKERAKERGISLKDAAGKHAIVAENGAIVTTYRKNIGRRDIAQELRRRTLSNHEVRHELELSSGGTARLIIGKRGESIQRLEKAHGIRAAVTKRNETKNNPRFLILVGPKEGVAEASRKVQDVIDKNSSTKSTLPEGHAVIERAVPRKKIGQIMGKKGWKIQSLRDRHKIQVAMDSDQVTSLGDEEKCKVLLLKGPKDNVTAAAEELKKTFKIQQKELLQW